LQSEALPSPPFLWYKVNTLKLTAQVKLTVTPEQADALKRTMQAANTVCDSISAWAWENKTFGQFPLHKAQYANQRAASGLTAQVIVRCIGKVADAYKLDRNSIRTFQPTGAIAFDDRILNWYVDKGEVSIWSVDGRLRLPFVCGEYQRALLAYRQGESDLAFVDGSFYLLSTVSIPDPPLIETDGVLGVDLGIVQLATDSEGNQYSGEAVKSCRRRAQSNRSCLQKRGTKRAKRTLKQRSRKASRFCRWVNHNISKAIVAAAVLSRKAISLEDLKGIRERGSAFSRETRWQLGNWAFNQLASFIVYKAKRAGVPVVFVDPRNTSRTCSRCGYCDKGNRKSQSQFLCLECGFAVNADFNAALNIGARAVVNAPIVATACG
jgi:IS605 OrfB family transposase